MFSDFRDRIGGTLVEGQARPRAPTGARETVRSAHARSLCARPKTTASAAALISSSPAARAVPRIDKAPRIEAGPSIVRGLAQLVTNEPAPNAGERAAWPGAVDARRAALRSLKRG